MKRRRFAHPAEKAYAELLDEHGILVPGPFNATTRTVTLKAAPAADTTAAHSH